MSVTHTRLSCHNAEFRARWDQRSGVIRARGDLDAANADQFSDYVANCVQHFPKLILDLSAVDFIATAGFSALHRINVACSAADVQWAMVPSRAVSRLLRICDPDGVLPVVEPTKRPDPDQDALLELIPESS
jgi:anti-anti-sigma factor